MKRSQWLIFALSLALAVVGTAAFVHYHPTHAQQPSSVFTNGTVDLSGQPCTAGSINVYTGLGILPSLQMCNSSNIYVTSPVIRAFDQTGNPLVGYHASTFTATLNGLVLPTATVTLTNSAVFTSNTTYSCVVDYTGPTVQLVLVTSYTSGSQFTITSTLSLSNAPIRGHCWGY